MAVAVAVHLMERTEQAVLVAVERQVVQVLLVVQTLVAVAVAGLEMAAAMQELVDQASLLLSMRLVK